MLLLTGGVAAQEAVDTLPDGVTFAIRLEQSIDASKAQVGDEVRARLMTPVLLQGKIAIPKDADIRGQVVKAVPLAASEESRLAIVFNKASWRGGSMLLHASIVRHLVLKAVVSSAEDRRLCPPVFRFVEKQQSGTSGQQTAPPQNPAPQANVPPPVPPPPHTTSPLDECEGMPGRAPNRRTTAERVTFTSPPLDGIQVSRAEGDDRTTQLSSARKNVVLKRGTMFELRNVR